MAELRNIEIRRGYVGLTPILGCITKYEGNKVVVFVGNPREDDYRPGPMCPESLATFYKAAPKIIEEYAVLFSINKVNNDAVEFEIEDPWTYDTIGFVEVTLEEDINVYDASHSYVGEGIETLREYLRKAIDGGNEGEEEE